MMNLTFSEWTQAFPSAPENCWGIGIDAERDSDWAEAAVLGDPFAI